MLFICYNIGALFAFDIVWSIDPQSFYQFIWYYFCEIVQFVSVKWLPTGAKLGWTWEELLAGRVSLLLKGNEF